MSDSLWEAWSEEALGEIVEKKVDNWFEKGFDDVIKESIKQTTVGWLLANIYSKSDIEYIIKEVMVEKLKEFSFEELKTLLTLEDKRG